MIKGVSLEGLDGRVFKMLRFLAEHVSFDVVVTSAFRSVEHEKSKGRDGSSSHCKGLAVDVAVKDSFERASLLFQAFNVGFPRIGIGPNFIHLDIDLNKAHPIVWTYYENK